MENTQKMGTKKMMVIWAIITIILMGGSYYVGMKHGQSARMTAARAQFGGAAGGVARTGARFAAGSGSTMGDIIAKDATSFTVKMRDGSSKIVLYSGSTQFAKSAAGSSDDVTVGTAVTVLGTQNSDGSVTAQSVQIRPSMPQGAAGATGAAPTAGQPTGN